MVAIKGVEIPKQCASCFARTMVDGNISTYEICALTQSVLSTEDLCDKRNHNCPLVDIQERKVGKWIYDKASQNWRCSVCNETPKTLGYVGTADFMEKEFTFCNHCGAEMVGAENG